MQECDCLNGKLLKDLNSKYEQLQKENDELNQLNSEYQEILSEKLTNCSSLNDKKEMLSLKNVQSSINSLMIKVESVQKEYERLAIGNKSLLKDNKILRQQQENAKQAQIQQALQDQNNKLFHDKINILQTQIQSLQKSNQQSLDKIDSLKDQIISLNKLFKETFNFKNIFLLFLNFLSLESTEISKDLILDFLKDYQDQLDEALRIKKEQEELEEKRRRELEEQERLRNLIEKEIDDNSSECLEDGTNKRQLWNKVQGAFYEKKKSIFAESAKLIKKKSSINNQELINQTQLFASIYQKLTEDKNNKIEQKNHDLNNNKKNPQMRHTVESPQGKVNKKQPFSNQQKKTVNSITSFTNNGRPQSTHNLKIKK